MKPRQAFQYSIIKDQHMYYFLQSAPKVQQLIATGLYRLQADSLQEIATKEAVRLDPYVLEALKQTPLASRDQNQSQQELAAVLQSQKFKAFEEERQRLRKMRQGRGQSRVRWQGEGIKGVRQFLARRQGRREGGSGPNAD